MNNKFSWQSFISIALLFSFIVMLFSGIVLYIAPEGSLSRWIGWDVIGLTKKQWEQQHTVFSYLFILFSVFHIFKINWSLLLSYLSPVNLHISNIKEILIAFLILIFVFFGTLSGLPPFKQIINLGGNISDSYSQGVVMPDVADAEKLTMEQFAAQVLEISYTEFESIIKSLNFINVDNNIRVMDFCKDNKLTPQELYIIIQGELLKMGLVKAGVPDVTSLTSFVSDPNSIL